MEKIYEKMVELYTRMNDRLKDSICEQMKSLGEIRFNSKRNFPFINVDGEYVGVNVAGLRYDQETGDVIVLEKHNGVLLDDWSIQEDGTVDGCLELLYYVEEEAFRKV